MNVELNTGLWRCWETSTPDIGLRKENIGMKGYNQHCMRGYSDQSKHASQFESIIERHRYINLSLEI
jgi:hypothetical protein